MMMSSTRLPGNVGETILRVLKSYGAERVSVFGSYARGEAGPESDIDILVRFKEIKSLLELARIQDELEQTLHHKVDLLHGEGGQPLSHRYDPP
jgi:uncharacterized protein